MGSALGQFQDGFRQALLAPAADAAGMASGIAALALQPGFAVYRNTVLKACIDALQANFPAVTRLVGTEWMRSAAACYARRRLPEEACLLYYGDAFPDFLAQFGPAAGLPYLPGVARLDRYWTEAHAAADHAPLDPADIAGLAPAALAAAVLHPHPSARWAWFDAVPAFTIWRRNREAPDEDGELEWRGEGALLVRARGVVEWMALDAAGCAFLDACMHGRPLAEAAAAACAAQADADLARLLAGLLDAGAFARVTFFNALSSRSNHG